MPNLTYEQIEPSILTAYNKYEGENGVNTIRIEERYRDGDSAVFYGAKSDGTHTIFIAFRTSRQYPNSWVWLCPSEPQIMFFKTFLPDLYGIVDRRNAIMRDTTDREIALTRLRVFENAILEMGREITEIKQHLGAITQEVI